MGAWLIESHSFNNNCNIFSTDFDLQINFLFQNNFESAKQEPEILGSRCGISYAHVTRVIDHGLTLGDDPSGSVLDKRQSVSSHKWNEVK